MNCNLASAKAYCPDCMNSPVREKNKLPIILLISALLLFLAAELSHFPFQQNDEKLIRHSESLLNALDKQMEGGIEKIFSFTNESSLHDFFMHSGLETRGISYYFFLRDSLIRWSDNQPVLSENLPDVVHDHAMLHLANGWFYCRTATRGDTTLLSLLLVRNEFAYENTYLRNTFNPALGLPEDSRISTSEGLPLQGPDGKVLCNIIPDSSTGISITSSWLYAISGILLLMGVYFLGLNLFRKRKWQGFMLLAVVLIGRIVMIALKFPEVLYNTDLFSPRNYASSFLFNSLGDLLINACLVTTFSYLFFTLSRKRNPDTNSGKFFLPALLIFLILSGIGIHLLYTDWSLTAEFLLT